MKKFILLFLLIISTSVSAEETYKLQIISKDILPTSKIEYTDAYYRICNENETQSDCIARYRTGLDEEKAIRLADADNTISHPPISTEPTEEDLLVQKQLILDQKTLLDSQIVEIDSKVNELQIAKLETESAPKTETLTDLIETLFN